MTRPELQALLDRLAKTGQRHLRTFTLRESFQTALSLAFLAFALIPVVFLCTFLIQNLFDISLWNPAWYELLLLSLLTGLLGVGSLTLILFSRHQPRREQALALFDKQLENKDSLQIADEFLNSSGTSSFEQAALSHATKNIEIATKHQLQPVALKRPHFRKLQLRSGLACLGLMLGALYVQAFVGENTTEGLSTEISLAAPSSLADKIQEETQNVILEAEEETREPANPMPELAMVAASDSLINNRPNPLSSKSEKKSQSQQASTAANAANEASSASNSQQSSGFKSDADEQSQKQTEPKAKERQSTNKPKTPKTSPEFEESSNQLAGTSKSGSNSRVSASPTSDSNYPTRENTDLDDSDMEPEDEEDEEQEAGASSKPLMEQRKAPADRQLSPSGAGAQEENPDANGRSGAGGLKKTRGVAAKLLGVPMPDQLSGHSNPGRIKINRKHAEPNQQLQEVADTFPHGTIDETIGPVDEPRISPQMRELLKAYFNREQTI